MWIRLWAAWALFQAGVTYTGYFQYAPVYEPAEWT